jgi:uncharacterized protein YwgA
LDIPVELYAPYGTPHEQLQPEFLAKEPKSQYEKASMQNPEWIKEGWVALVEIINRLEKEPYHWPIGRIIFQKIAYVATLEGIPTGLTYKKSSYGPFSSEFKRIITRLVNNGLVYEKHLGNMFSYKVGRTYEDARKTYLNQLEQWESQIEKIVDLFMRVRREQSEVVATVLFVADELINLKKEEPTESEILQEVMKWKQRRRPPINEGEVAYTIRNLAALNWLKVKPSADLPIPEELLVDV